MAEILTVLILAFMMALVITLMVGIGARKTGNN